MIGALLVGAPALAGDFADVLARAQGDRETWPRLSVHQPDADLDRAYAHQRDFFFAEDPGRAIAGYKAGLSSVSSQARWKISEPIAGVIPGLGRLEGSPTLPSANWKSLIVEVEFAFEMASEVREPLPDRAALREVIASLRPAVELADSHFLSLDGLRAIDLIAVNVAASHLHVGPALDPDDVDLAGVDVVLKRGEETLVDFRAAQSDADPWEAIRWLVNDRLARGWPVRAGHVLIAGSLGVPFVGTPGDYAADFGSLGRLRFRVHP